MGHGGPTAESPLTDPVRSRPLDSRDARVALEDSLWLGVPPVPHPNTPRSCSVALRVGPLLRSPPPRLSAEALAAAQVPPTCRSPRSPRSPASSCCRPRVLGEFASPPRETWRRSPSNALH